ncbi:PRTase-like protein [Russula dissimulans]|nr:PRTase-like protein [Russula dissimulans]
MASEPLHHRLTYNEVHNVIKRSAEEIVEFKPDLILAIGRDSIPISRTFLKHPKTRGSVPIFAIGLSLYESVAGIEAEQIGNQVIRTQWLYPGKTLLGKRVLIVDEVDDTRTTLQYAVSELQKDVDEAVQLLPESEREGSKPQFAVFAVHNKLKPKLGSLPADVPYFAGEEVGDVWLDYPWEATDIEEHDQLALAQKTA